MKKYLSTVIFALIFLAGLSLMLYPTVSNYINSMHQSEAIATYADVIAKLDQRTYKDMWDEAVEYNKRLAKEEFNFNPSKAEIEEYNGILDVMGTGIMAYIEIPKINVSLPIYHSTEENVLQVGIGHIAGSSLPVGGESSHCVLSGHRGLPSAKLFTDIDKLIDGDEFTIVTLDESLTYEVDQILTVLPAEVDKLLIEDGKDYCTLVTCTPYGINTHRLLVRGHRITKEEKEIHVVAEAIQIEPKLVAVAIALPILIVWVAFTTTKRKKKRGE
ncbi:MAG: class C sortase [Ruminococcus sp.]|nr:class C sortase [Ruminococcus sp.]